MAHDGTRWHPMAPDGWEYLCEGGCGGRNSPLGIIGSIGKSRPISSTPLLLHFSLRVRNNSSVELVPKLAIVTLDRGSCHSITVLFLSTTTNHGSNIACAGCPIARHGFHIARAGSPTARHGFHIARAGCPMARAGGLGEAFPLQGVWGRNSPLTMVLLELHN